MKFNINSRSEGFYMKDQSDDIIKEKHSENFKNFNSPQFQNFFFETDKKRPNVESKTNIRFGSKTENYVSGEKKHFTANKIQQQESLFAKHRKGLDILKKGIQYSNKNAQYSDQETVYLDKIRNQIVDDYYTKGIFSTIDTTKEIEFSEEEDDIFDDQIKIFNKNKHESFEFDISNAYLMMKNVKNNKKFKFNQYFRYMNSENSKDVDVTQRLEWQSMLNSVITGDIVKSEKIKIIENNFENKKKFFGANYKQNLWIEIQAKIYNRTFNNQHKQILFQRSQVDPMIEEILKFKINYDVNRQSDPSTQVSQILKKYDSICVLWPTLEDFKNDMPICRLETFENKINILISWLKITSALSSLFKTFKIWIGNENLDISISKLNCNITQNFSSSTINTVTKFEKFFNEENKSFVENLLKEKDFYTIFKNRIFTPIAPWMVKSKEFYISFNHVSDEIGLPNFLEDLIILCKLPMRLIKEIINTILCYAMKLQNPTLMIIDKMIEDFKSYITIALEVKLTIYFYCKPEELKNWNLSSLFKDEISNFDKVVLKCVNYFFLLLNRKLLDSSRSYKTFRTFKEPDELKESWNHLKFLCDCFEGASIVIYENLTLLLQKMFQRLFFYFKNQIHTPISNLSETQGPMRWYKSTIENFGKLSRKLKRFNKEVKNEYKNSILFNLNLSLTIGLKVIIEELKKHNHFLIKIAGYEDQGIHLFGSEDLFSNEKDIIKILHGSYLGGHLTKENFDNFDFLKMIHKNNLSNNSYFIEENSDSSIIAIFFSQTIFWNGKTMNIIINEIPILSITNNQLMIITKTSYQNLKISKNKMIDFLINESKHEDILIYLDERCSLKNVHNNLISINKLLFKITLIVLDSVKIVIEKCKDYLHKQEYQSLINNYYIYVKSYAKNSISTFDVSKKLVIILKLIDISIDWLSFVCDKCDPSCIKTFKSCVLALEFAMDVTKGNNILVLTDKQFDLLKLKVARCMSLLISHFDIMGARSCESEKKKLLKWGSQLNKFDSSEIDEYLLNAYKEDVLKAITEIENYRSEIGMQLKSIGKVVDLTDIDYKYVTLLASSVSSVSIRWQKSRFIGQGTFGNVFLAVNLDTGGLIAVKEIKFNVCQSVKNIITSIKRETEVLEILNHPNIVQYFGVEVHRNKVYLFMEYCNGGSLSDLLLHGRIEDEMVIQFYTLQMLKGLAYLHQSGVVHHDIKPENILLDHNGVLKFIDFGTAQILSNEVSFTDSEETETILQSDTKKEKSFMSGTPMYMSPEIITGSFNYKNSAVDIWSLGCCIVEMATGKRPWINLDNKWAIMYHIAAVGVPLLPTADQLSEPGMNFIKKCLTHNSEERPSAFELLNDPWILSIRKMTIENVDGNISNIVDPN